MAFHLKLIQPKELPADGLTSAEFKPWTNHLTNFLQQDVENFRFLKGANYSTWSPASESATNTRIIALHADDPDHLAINAENLTNPQKVVKRVRLLNMRNAQLGKLLQHVSSFVYYTETDDIDQLSKSMEWIFTYLRQHYNIEAKGSNLLKITEHTFKSGTSHQVFYKQFRTSWLNNLRKQGEVMTHKGGKVIDADETLSPTFEDAIVLWALEKIDPRLPKKVRKDYEHRLSGDTYLIDLQVTIFQSIPTMLEDLDKQAGLNAIVAEDGRVPALSAIKYRGTSHIKRGGRDRSTRPGKRPWSKIFCQFCHSAGKPSQVFTGHTTALCPNFSNRDRRDMLVSLKAMDLLEQDEDEDNTWEVKDEELAEEEQG